MKIQKTVENIAILLICFSAVALAGLNIYQHVQIRQAAQKGLSDAPSGDNSMPESATAALEHNGQNQAVSTGNTRTGDSEADELSYQLDAAEEELSMVKEQLAADEAKKAKRKQILKELQKKSLENPAYSNSLKQSILSQYDDLFDKLNLSSEKSDSFKELLFEEVMAQQDIYLEYGDLLDLPEEHQKEYRERLSALNEEYEAKKRESLGDSDYATYQDYNETQGKRYRVNNFMESMGSDETLSEAQKEALIEAMNEEMQYVEREKIDRGDGFTYSDMYSEANRTILLTNYSRTTDAYLKAANSILSASQLESFESYLENDFEQYGLHLEMMALEYGTSAGNENTAVRVE